MYYPPLLTVNLSFKKKKKKQLFNLYLTCVKHALRGFCPYGWNKVNILQCRPVQSNYGDHFSLSFSVLLVLRETDYRHCNNKE